MKRFYQTGVGAVVLCSALVAHAEAPPTLQEIVAKTVTSNPEVQAQYHTFRAAEYERDVARGELLPHADINSTYRRQEDVGPNIGNTNIPERQTQLILSQLLFDGFATRNEVNRLSHAARVRYYELLATMQNIALEVVRTYIDIQRFRQLVSFAQDNYIVHKQLFDRIQERVEAGVGRRVDLEQASGRLALAEANLLTELTNLHDVEARYQRLVGELPPATLLDVDFYKSGVSPTATEALQLAYQQNPSLLSTIENIIAAQREVASRRGVYSPRLDLQARKNLDVSSDGANSTSAADVLELTLRFNLFNGGSDKAAVNQTLERLNNSEALRDRACVDTRQELVIAYNDIQRLKEQLIYRDQHQLAIEKAREAYRKQFDIGQRTLLDLLDTENEFFQARRTYAVTEKDLYIAFARTYATQGELLARLGVSRSDLPEFTRADYMDNETVCQAVAPTMIKLDKAALVADAKPISDTLVSLVNKQISQPKVLPNEKEVVAGRIQQWVTAWEQKNFDAYINMYSKNFEPVGFRNKEAWLENRKQRIAKSGPIRITLQDINITVTGNKAIAEFMQIYSSPTYSDKVMKQLVLELEQENKQWVIVKETVK
ncbi:MAG TPA: TolC family outer membrane protein [Methylophilaceae bacterium]|nr:TolC family outer membrane protein [Methylophilaceae bacterium]